MKSLAPIFLLACVSVSQAGSPNYFVPTHRISGIGVDRDDLSDHLLSARAELMVQAQTFVIMREGNALNGARRITGDPKLQALFREAARRSGFPQSTLEAIAYLESWGDAKAESWAGSPAGIMQIAPGTAHDMGLKIEAATRYKVTRERVAVKGRGSKTKYKTVVHKVPYRVTVRDERMLPERAIPAAAMYLAGMEQRFGGRDWAIFAYHCGQGCVSEMIELTRRARGIAKDQVTVPRMFFSTNPAWNRELYQAIQQQMQRDYSPTYYFRVRRAEELLALYRDDPAAFTFLFAGYRGRLAPNLRAPYRLSVWLKPEDMVFRTGEDIRQDAGGRLGRALDRPEFFGYELRIPRDLPEYFQQASPAALGTLAYLAFETHRLFDEVKPRGEKFRPLPVTSLVKAGDFAAGQGGRESVTHCSGEVFDIAYAGLPPGEFECLRFVLEDMEWDGYVGFVEEGRENLHIGCSPEARGFFATVFQEAAENGGTR